MMLLLLIKRLLSNINLLFYISLLRIDLEQIHALQRQANLQVTAAIAGGRFEVERVRHHVGSANQFG